MTEIAPKPASILFVVHSLGHGGMERQLAAIACGLDRSRFDPHVAYVVDGYRADELRRHGVSLVRIPIRNFWKPGPQVLSAMLAEYIREHNIRLVHLFDTGLGLVTALAVRKVGDVIFLTSQRSFMKHLPKRYRYLLLGAHWVGDGVVVNCNATRDYFTSTYRYPLHRIEVCYNGIDTSVFKPGPRQRLEALRDTGLVLGCVCVFRREKNLVQLIEAFARVRQKFPGIKLLLMGSGPDEARVRAAVAAAGIQADCLLIPSAADVSPAMRSIDVFVHPSLTESLPNAVMEAMASGCCVVATRVGGCPELIEHGVDGLLAEPGSLTDLVQCVTSAISDSSLRERLGAAAARRIAETFSLQESLRTMEGIYSRALLSTKDSAFGSQSQPGHFKGNSAAL